MLQFFMEFMIGQHILNNSQMRENVGGKAIYKTWRSTKIEGENHPSKMLAIEDHWLRAELERNRRSRRAEKAQGELEQSLDPYDHQGGFYSGMNLQTESQPFVRKERLSDMTGNS